MDNRNINEEENVAYDRDATLANKVSNKIGTRLSADIPKPEVPKAPIPQVNTLDERKLRNELDYKNNIPQTKIDTTVGKPTDADVKAEGVRIKTEGKARIAEAKEKYQEELEARHRKAEKMWSAIGDGISAIANMATVGAGADSMYNPADSLHSKVKSKWDEIKANKAAIAAANRKAQMDLLLADLGYQHASKENEKNRQSKWDEFYTKLKETNRHNQEMEAIARDRAESYETNAQANKTRASKYKGGGSSGGGKNSQGKWELVGPDGKTEYYDTQAEWEARAKEIALDAGVSLTTNSGWKKVKKDAKQVVAEVNAANKKKAEKPKSTGKKLNLLQ